MKPVIHEIYDTAWASIRNQVIKVISSEVRKQLRHNEAGNLQAQCFDPLIETLWKKFL